MCVCVALSPQITASGSSFAEFLNVLNTCMKTHVAPNASAAALRILIWGCTQHPVVSALKRAALIEGLMGATLPNCMWVVESEAATVQSAQSESPPGFLPPSTTAVLADTLLCHLDLTEDPHHAERCAQLLARCFTLVRHTRTLPSFLHCTQ